MITFLNVMMVVLIILIYANFALLAIVVLGRLKTGTKSILFGAHAFWLHPWFVAAAWWRLYGFPLDPRLWAAFFVHDLGYWGLDKMDDEVGEWHPAFGAKIMGFLFHHGDWNSTWFANSVGLLLTKIFGPVPSPPDRGGEHSWYTFCFYHSRFLAKRYGTNVTRLCVADKLSIALTPAWLYLPMTHLSGEIHEYLKLNAAANSKYTSMKMDVTSERTWYAGMQSYLKSWAYEHRDLREDTWTPAT